MMRVLAIARSALTETIRQPIYLVVILAALLTFALAIPLTGWTMGGDSADYKRTDQQMLVSTGLSTLLAAGLFIAAFSASGVLAREIEQRTILTVISKPVSRASVVIGKFLGVSAALMVAYYLCSLGFLMSVRHGVIPTAADPLDWPVIVIGFSALALTLLSAALGNYYFGWPFGSGAVAAGLLLLTLGMGVISFVGKGWTIVPVGYELEANLFKAMLLGLLAVLILAAVAVTASTRLGTLSTLLACLAFFAASSVTESILGPYVGSNAVARWLYRIWPNLAYLYAIDVLLQEGRSIPGGYVGLTAAYAALEIVAIVALGVALFQTRELEVSPESGPARAPLLVTALAWLGRIGGLVCAVAGLAILGRGGPPVDLAIGVGLLLAAGAMWVFWGFFARGARWAYVLALLGGLVKLGLLAAFWVAPILAGQAVLPTRDKVVRIASAISAAAAIAVLLLPHVRRHFNLVRRHRSAQSQAAAANKPE